MKKHLVFGIVMSLLLISGVLLANSRELALTSFNISPNPMTHFTSISLGFSEDCIVTVWIEENGGAIVKYLYSGMAQKQLNLHWNRISDSGVYATAGTYHVVVNYRGRYTSTKKTLILR